MIADQDVTIEVVDAVTDELVDAWNVLLPQLSKSAKPLDEQDLDAVVNGPGTSLLVAKLDGRIVGSLTLALFSIPTGKRAWIEDVVVDADTRGKGIGEKLTRAAIDLAAQQGARTVDLTSRPSREAANRLYQRVGFEARETNVYRYAHDA